MKFSPGQIVNVRGYGYPFKVLKHIRGDIWALAATNSPNFFLTTYEDQISVPEKDAPAEGVKNPD